MRHHNEIVVGHSLAAVTYAYLNDATLILNCQDSKPFLFDFFEPEFDLSMFALHPVIYEMQAQESKRTVGFPKIDLWHRALFAISISGNLPLSNKLSSLRINEQEKVITLITLDGTRIEYGYNTLRIFNVDKIQGGFSPSLPEKYRVVDTIIKEIQDLKQKNTNIDGQFITDILTVNGIRFSLEDGSWGLVRASSNKPSLVIVTESTKSNERKKKIF